MEVTKREWKISMRVPTFILLVYIGCSTVTATATKDNKDFSSTHMMEKKRQELIPYPRVGRGFETVQNFLLTMHKSLPPTVANSDHGSSRKETGGRHQGPLSEYMLPYPRPGRSNDLLTPYPRLGKRTTSDHNLDRVAFLSIPTSGSEDYLSEHQRMDKRLSMDDDDEVLETGFMTPYPRMGKRDDMLLPYPRMGRNGDILLPYPRMGRDSDVLLPYPRMGRDSDILLPYPRLGRSVPEEATTKSPRHTMTKNRNLTTWRNGHLVKRNTDFAELDEDQYENNDEEHENNGQETLIPYPRLGRQTSSDFLLKNAKYFVKERSKGQTYPNVMEDNPNPHYLLPYPRPGRSSGHQDSSQEQDLFILPYPRIGK